MKTKNELIVEIATACMAKMVSYNDISDSSVATLHLSKHSCEKGDALADG